MKKLVILWCVGSALLILFFSQTKAEVVGHFTQTEGQVDLLKGGKIPATAVKLNDAVEPKDIIRTKSLSRAQITFIDNSILTISPESRIAIEEYLVNLPQEKRQAVLEIFQGVALAVVNKIFKAQEPDFVVKTHTAIMGVRGTEIGIRIHPNSSTVLNFKGLTQVGNIFPEVSQSFQKAFRFAYSFGPLGDTSGRWVMLKDMQATTVDRNLPPTLPYQISNLDRENFMKQLTTVAPSVTRTYQGANTARNAAMPASTAAASMPVSIISPGEQSTFSILSTITVPPTVIPPTATPPAVIPEPPAVIPEPPAVVTPPTLPSNGKLPIGSNGKILPLINK